MDSTKPLMDLISYETLNRTEGRDAVRLNEDFIGYRCRVDVNTWYTGQSYNISKTKISDVMLFIVT